MVRKNFLDRLFPLKYDFYGMLREQAEVTAEGTKSLLTCLKVCSMEYSSLSKLSEQADTIRLNMERKLIEAFTTPFDRQDIYDISVQMNRIIEYSKYALQSIIEFEVQPDEVIFQMVQQLDEGTSELAQAIALLEKNPIDAQKKIVKMRTAQAAVDNYYIKGMAALFKTTDLMNSMKYHEIYFQIREAVIYLGYTVDVFHRIVVRLV